jgi:hypothetical protein
MEPEQPIEEMLKASARKRRAEFGSDPSMPNPMRARLHEEIAPVGRPEEKLPRFRFAWPRLALATAAVALLVGLPILWQWRASNPPRTISAAHETEMAAPAAEARARTDEKSRAETKEAGDIAGATGQVAAAAAAPAAAKTAGVTQQFAQITPLQEPAKAPNVLSSFRLEHNGESVRVIDADGSTYTGRMERLALSDARALANQKLDFAAQKTRATSAAKKEKNEAANEYYIHASGYNAQLKKALLFEGNYIAPASAANETHDKDKANASQARIVGTAKVEGAPPVEVNATAVPP